MVDSVANRRSGTMKENEAIVRNTERVNSTIETSDGDKSKGKGVTASSSLKQYVPEEMKSQITTRSTYQRGPIAETIVQVKQDVNLPVSGGMQDKLDGTESVPVKYSVQFLSNQASIFQSSGHNQKLFDAITCKRKGSKDETLEKVQEFTFAAAQHACKSDKANTDDRTNKTESRTETLRLKLWEILATVSSPKSQNPSSQIRNIDEGNLQHERHLVQKDDKVDSLVSSRKKGQGKNPKTGRSKICFTINDSAGKFQQETSRSDTPLYHEDTSSHVNKTEAFQGCLPDKQRKCFDSEKDFQEEQSNQTPQTKKTDHHRQCDSSAEWDQEDGRDNLFTENNAKQQDNFQSPTFGFRTPPLSSSPSSTERKVQTVNDVSSPTTDERIVSLGNFHNLRTFQIVAEELKDTVGRKAQSSLEKDEQDGRSDSSSEERDFGSSQEGSRERDTFPEADPAEKQKFMLRPIKRLCIHECIKVNDTSPVSPSQKGTGESDWVDGTSEKNQENGFERGVELFVLELGKLKRKIQSVTKKKSSEILKSVAQEIHLQLQNVQSQTYTNMGKLTSHSNSKRKRLETRFEDQQKQLRLIHEKFKEELNQHLYDCRSTVEGLEAHMIEFKGNLEKQRVSHCKLLSQLEEATEIQLNDAQKKITDIHELARGKMLQLKHVISVFERG